MFKDWKRFHQSMPRRIATQMKFNGEADLNIAMNQDEVAAWNRLTSQGRQNLVQNMFNRLLNGNRPGMLTDAMLSREQPIGPDAMSQNAAEKAKPSYTQACRRILRILNQAGEDGFTDEEGQEMLHMAGNSYRPARVALVKLGYAGKSGKSRKTRSGRPANIWVALMSPEQAELEWTVEQEEEESA